MAEGRIRTYGPHGEPIPQHIFVDHDWVREHEDQLVEQFGACYIIVHQGEVLGTGKTYQEAIDNAEVNLSPDSEAVEVIVDWIGQHYSTFSISPVVNQNHETD
jgi:hypothetical protein